MSTLRPSTSQRAKQAFCWLPPESKRSGWSRWAARISRRSIQLCAWFASRGLDTENKRTKRSIKGKSDIGTDAEVGDNALALAFGSDESDARVAALARVRGDIGRTSERNACAGQRSQRPVDGPAKLVDPGAEQAEDAENLASVERKGHAVERAGQTQIFDLQRNLADACASRWVKFINSSAEHGVENLAPRSRVSGEIAGV